MARSAKKIAKPAAQSRPAGEAELEEESCDRLADCRARKSEFAPDFRESYFFAAPHRVRTVQTSGSANKRKPADQGEAATSFPCELAGDFTTAVLEAFMPQAEPWCERRPGIFAPPEIQEEATKLINEQDPKIFDAMRASNLYAELPKAFTPDLAIGTFGMWIDDPRPAENFVTQAVPLGELEVNLGPFGLIDDRFAIRQTKFRHLPAVLGREVTATLPDEIKEKIKKKPKEPCEVRWGFWRLWDRYDDEWWQRVVLVDDKLVDHGELNGEGCCPLIAGRFNAGPDFPFGHGPLLQGLPDLRQLDENESQKADAIEMSIAGPISYPHDSIAALEGGLESRAAYPIRVGDQDAIKKIYEPGSIEAALFENANLERRLKKLFYSDRPEQRGDTPPTATQWLDEVTELQRRIGTPGLSFWLEGPAVIFIRFKYMLEQRGVLRPVKVQGKIISLQPYNPAQRAAEQQEVAMATRALAICAQAFPEEFKAIIDGKETMTAIIDKMRAKLIKFRPAKDVQAAVSMIAQLTEGRLIQGRPEPALAGQL